ncbi:hypothetical protein WA556_002651 [Blastocystis sp. ATCC 50177/Nand II]
MPLTETRISCPSQRTFSAKMHRKANDSKFYQMERVLRKTLRVLLDDGRVVKGQFQCFDSSLNMIFVNTVEVAENDEIKRCIGRLIIAECSIRQYQVCSVA